MTTELQRAEADVLEAAKTWKARRLNRSPGTFNAARYSRACEDLDAAVVGLLHAQRCAAERAVVPLDVAVPTETCGV